MQGQLTLRGIPDTPVQADSRSVPAVAQTLLKELVRERHWKYETFCAEYEKAAVQVEADDTAPSSAQYYRWLSGQLKGGMPYPDACRVLEAMFAPWKTADLFGPYQPDAVGWNVMPETAGRRETQSAPPGDVLLFAQAYLAGPR